jgi:hypothetical protein
LSSRTVRICVIVAVISALVAGGIVAWAQFYRVRYYSEVVPGQIYRSRQLAGIRYRILRDDNIKRVISLRGYEGQGEILSEELAATAKVGAELVQLPVLTALPSTEQIERFMVAVRSSPGAVLVHCEHGRDRTGFMLAAYRVLMQDWAVEDAIQDQLVRFKALLPPDKLANIRSMLTEIKTNRQAWLDRTDPSHAGSSSRPATSSAPASRAASATSAAAAG